MVSPAKGWIATKWSVFGLFFFLSVEQAARALIFSMSFLYSLAKIGAKPKVKRDVGTQSSSLLTPHSETDARTRRNRPREACIPRCV